MDSCMVMQEDLMEELDEMEESVEDMQDMMMCAMPPAPLSASL